MTDRGLPLSRYADPADLDHPDLAALRAVVDPSFTRAREQHPMRRWEYTLALHAIDRWAASFGSETPAWQTFGGLPVADVGGAGSPFYHMTGADRTTVIDPDDGGYPVERWVREQRRTFPIVTCLSVIEHVLDLDGFCYALTSLVAPGGLLVLTMDACDIRPPDAAVADPFHFAWMRQRIFDRRAILALLVRLTERYDCHSVGGVDLHYPGPTVYDYTFASLVLQKRRA